MAVPVVSNNTASSIGYSGSRFDSKDQRSLHNPAARDLIKKYIDTRNKEGQQTSKDQKL